MDMKKIDEVIHSQDFYLPYGDYIRTYFIENFYHFFMKEPVLLFLLGLFIFSQFVHGYSPSEKKPKKTERKQSSFIKRDEPSPFLPFMLKILHVLSSYSLILLLVFSVKKIILHLHKMELKHDHPYLLKPIDHLFQLAAPYTDDMVKYGFIIIGVVIICDLLDAFGHSFLKKWLVGTTFTLFSLGCLVGFNMYAAYFSSVEADHKVKWKEDVLDPFIQTIELEKAEIDVSRYLPDKANNQVYIELTYINKKGKRIKKSGNIDKEYIHHTKSKPYMTFRYIPKTINDDYREGEQNVNIYLNLAEH